MVNMTPCTRPLCSALTCHEHLVVHRHPPQGGPGSRKGRQEGPLGGETDLEHLSRVRHTAVCLTSSYNQHLVQSQESNVLTSSQEVTRLPSLQYPAQPCPEYLGVLSRAGRSP